MIVDFKTWQPPEDHPFPFFLRDVDGWLFDGPTVRVNLSTGETWVQVRDRNHRMVEYPAGEQAVAFIQLKPPLRLFDGKGREVPLVDSPVSVSSEGKGIGL